MPQGVLQARRQVAIGAQVRRQAEPQTPEDLLLVADDAGIHHGGQNLSHGVIASGAARRQTRIARRIARAHPAGRQNRTKSIATLKPKPFSRWLPWYHDIS